MSPDNPIRLHAVIEGRVQGVGFRDFVLRNALMMELTGWVRNTASGNVEVLAEGTLSALESFLELLHQGPRSAVVTSLQVDWQNATGEFSLFQVTRTV